MEHLKTLGERVRFAREQSGMKQIALARKLGMSDSSPLSKLERTNQPTSSYVGQISEALNVRVTWLLHGRGPMRPDGPTGTLSLPIQDDDAMLYQYLDPRCARGPNAGDSNAPKLSVVTVAREDFDDLEVAEKDAAGYVQRDASLGHTMPIGHKGVLDLEDRDPRARSGDLFAILSGDAVIARRIVSYPSGRMTLTCDNADKRLYPDEDAAEDLRVIGRLVWASGKK